MHSHCIMHSHAASRLATTPDAYVIGKALRRHNQAPAHRHRTSRHNSLLPNPCLPSIPSGDHLLGAGVLVKPKQAVEEPAEADPAAVDLETSGSQGECQYTHSSPQPVRDSCLVAALVAAYILMWYLVSCGRGRVGTSRSEQAKGQTCNTVQYSTIRRAPTLPCSLVCLLCVAAGRRGSKAGSLASVREGVSQQGPLTKGGPGSVAGSAVPAGSCARTPSLVSRGAGASATSSLIMTRLQRLEQVRGRRMGGLEPRESCHCKLAIKQLACPD